jgi:hypothetical protein
MVALPFVLLMLCFLLLLVCYYAELRRRMMHAMLPRKVRFFFSSYSLSLCLSLSPSRGLSLCLSVFLFLGMFLKKVCVCYYAELRRRMMHAMLPRKVGSFQAASRQPPCSF